MEITPEDGTASVSYENAFKLALAYGPIVAVTHIVTPLDEHVTKLFFYEGKSHIAFGFALGYDEEINDDGDVRYSKMCAMMMVLQSIWGLGIEFTPDNLIPLGYGDDVKDAFKAGKNVAYHFTAPEKIALRQTLDSDGMLAFSDSAGFLEEDKHDIRTPVE